MSDNGTITIMRDKRYFYFFLLISISGLAGCNGDNTLSCVYTPKQSTDIPYPEPSQYSDCATFGRQGNISFNPKHLSTMWFDEDNLSAVHVNNSYYYVHRSGRTARTHMFDNGADYFKSGLARTTKNNKFGFINKRLEIVIQPEYDFAFPFEDKHAIVCNGCKSVKVGEHKEVRGGKWGYIDKQGKVITPVKFKRDELPAPPSQ